jgi:hypothetical protein
MSTPNTPDPSHEHLDHLDDLQKHQLLNSAELPYEETCLDCGNARWLVAPEGPPREAAPFARVAEAIAGDVIPCRLCGLAIH